MAPRPRQHVTIIKAIESLGDVPFSGWDLTHLTGLPRTTVHRVMHVLLEMGLLTRLGSGGHIDPWKISISWVSGAVTEQYECWLVGRRLAKRRLDRAPGNAVQCRPGSEVPNGASR